MRYASFLLILLVGVPLSAQERPLVIRNATVETLAAPGRLERATVVVRGGKIVSVGKEAAVPDDATIVDAAGGTLLPGMIDPAFEVSIAAATADTGPRTVVVRGRPVTLPGGLGGGRGGAFTVVGDNFSPFDPAYKSLPRIGLTRLNLVTSNGVGQSAVIRVTPADPGQMLDRPNGIAFVSVTNSSESLDQVRTRLDGAARGRSGGGAGRGGAGPLAPAPGTALWADVHQGKSILLASPANSAAVLHLLKALEPYKSVQLALSLSGDLVAEVLPALKSRPVRVLLRPGLDLLPNTRDRYNPARMLHEAGIDFAFSLSARPARAAVGGIPLPDGDGDTTPLAIDPEFPLFPVAILVKTGLPRTVALEALAKRPAQLLGMGATHGTIEPGKAADLLLYTGDPFNPASRLRHTIIDGRTVHAN